MEGISVTNTASYTDKQTFHFPLFVFVLTYYIYLNSTASYNYIVRSNWKYGQLAEQRRVVNWCKENSVSVFLSRE